MDVPLALNATETAPAPVLAAPIINLAVKNGFGFTLIVIFLSLVLLGTVLTQAYTYYTSYPRDRMWMKIYVAVIMVFDIASSVYACAWQYYLLVEYWGDQRAFMKAFTLLAINPVVCGAMGFLVHVFFAWRIQVLTRSRILTCIIGGFALMAVAGALSASLVALLAKDPRTIEHSLKPVASIWLLASVLADLAITLCLTYHFRKVRQETQELNHILNRILRSTVQNGLLTSVVALMDLLLFMINGSPNHTVSFLIPKLYANTVLSSLNARPVVNRVDDTMVEKGTNFSMHKDGSSYAFNTSAANSRSHTPALLGKSDTGSYNNSSAYPSRAVTPAPSGLSKPPLTRRMSNETDYTQIGDAGGMKKPPMSRTPSSDLLAAHYQPQPQQQALYPSHPQPKPVAQPQPQYQAQPQYQPDFQPPLPAKRAPEPVVFTQPFAPSQEQTHVRPEPAVAPLHLAPSHAPESVVNAVSRPIAVPQRGQAFPSQPIRGVRPAIAHARSTPSLASTVDAVPMPQPENGRSTRPSMERARSSEKSAPQSLRERSKSRPRPPPVVVPAVSGAF